MPNALCPCNSQKPYAMCCGPLLAKEKIAMTPEQLMRSRYTAYSQANIDYIEATMRAPAAAGFNRKQARAWASSVLWQGLNVIAVSEHGDVGEVEFVASYFDAGQLHHIKERSVFHRIQGRWYYVDLIQKVVL